MNELRSKKHLVLILICGVILASLSLFGRQQLNNSAASDGSTYASVLFGLVNQDRTSNGLPPLRFSQSLTSVANTRVQYMISRDVFSNVLEPGVLAENVGWNTGTDPTVAAIAINNAYMNSPEHRVNILDRRVNSLGISVTVAPNFQGFQNVWVDSEEFGIGTFGTAPKKISPQKPQLTPLSPSVKIPSVPSTGGACRK